MLSHALHDQISISKQRCVPLQSTLNLNISAGDDCPGEWRKATQSGVSFCRVASDNAIQTYSSANFSTNGISYQRVCGRPEDTRRETLWHFMGHIIIMVEQLMKTMYLIYQSLTVVILVSIFGLLLVVVVKVIKIFMVSLWRNIVLLVDNDYYCDSGSVYSAYYATYYFNDIYGMGKDVWRIVAMTILMQPWYNHQLNQITQDDIEARICAYGIFSSRSTLIDRLELFIQ